MQWEETGERIHRKFERGHHDTLSFRFQAERKAVVADNYIGFVDVGVLRSLQRKYFRPQGRVITEWFRGLAEKELMGERFLRLYWYDGEHDPSHPGYASQRKFLNAIGVTPGIQLRLGHLVARPEQPERPLQQKGVDTLLALDLVRLAGRSVFTTAVLIIDDRDFSEAIRAAQDFGVRVLIATPNKHRVASELTQLADGLIVIPPQVLEKMLPPPSDEAR